MIAYPLKFNPIFHYRIWGGNQLKTVLGKQYQAEQIGESWEISTVKNNISIVANGKFAGKSLTDLITQYPEDLLGAKSIQQFGQTFPLLIKLLDTAQPLSVQVHPNDDLAKQRHNSFGKTEMWYVIDANKGATNIIGFKEGVDKDKYQKAIENQSFNGILNDVPVCAEDVFYLPAGRVHAIGANILLAEIQQTSDVTYRIYDYDRLDKDGKKRELHTALALDAIDFSYINQPKIVYHKNQNTSNKVVECEYFNTDYLNLTQDFSLNKSTDSFMVLICTEGKASLQANGSDTLIQKGETVLLPACMQQCVIKTKAAKFLSVVV